MQACQYGTTTGANFPESCCLVECGWWIRRSVPPKKKKGYKARHMLWGLVGFSWRRHWVSLVWHMECLWSSHLVTISWYVTAFVPLETEYPLKLVRQIDQWIFHSLSSLTPQGQGAHRKGSLTCPLPCPCETCRGSTCASSLLGLFTLERITLVSLQSPLWDKCQHFEFVVSTLKRLQSTKGPLDSLW